MVKIVEITQTSNTITCDENGQAIILFNITNISSSSLRVGARIITKEPAQQSWFTLDGTAEKQIDIQATDQFSVSVSAENASEGDFKVSLMVYSVENPDEEYTESGTITVKIPSSDDPSPPASGFPKWIIWLLVGLVIASLLGVIGYMVVTNGNNNEPPITNTLAMVPDVTGKTLEDATAELESMEFTDIEIQSRFDASKAKDTVLEQTPEAKSKQDPSKTVVVLTLANSITTMPDIKDMTLQGATDKLREKGFNTINEELKFDASKPAGTVLGQSPEADASVSSSETVVTLTVADAGQEVPDLNGKSLSDAVQKLQEIGLGVGVVTSKANKNKLQDTIFLQVPASKKFVEKGSTVALTIADPGKTKTTAPVLTFPAIPIKPVVVKCSQAVQGKVAWDYKNNKRWAASNIKRLCKGAENSVEPAKCFNRVMHGGINWGGGTKWQWANVINLCEGSKNATSTIRCFQGLIKRRVPWKTAIQKCS
ncbi:MAG: PASTA domain-containing protein [Methylococcaceae bacterium]